MKSALLFLILAACAPSAGSTSTSSSSSGAASASSSQPSSSAAESSSSATSAGECATLALSGPVVQTQYIPEPFDPSSLYGGTIGDGVYHLTTSLVSTGDGGYAGTIPGSSRETWSVTGTAFAMAYEVTDADGGVQSGTAAGFFGAAQNSITVAYGCPSDAQTFSALYVAADGFFMIGYDNGDQTGSTALYERAQ